MNDIQTIIDQIPLRFDLSSHLMLLGVVQGFFLAFVIFLRAKNNSAINLFGWVLVIECLVFSDVYLCYTGLMKYVIHFNDSTEFLGLLIAPSMYFFLVALLERKSFSLKKYWPHLILPIFYLLSQFNYYLSPVEVKLNAYLGAYYRNLGFLEVPEDFNHSYHFIKDEYRWLILISFTFYAILSLILILRSRKKGWVASKNIKVDKYVFSLNTIIIFIIILFTLLLIYLNFDDDGGDHYIGIIQTVTIYITAFFMLSESRFFEKSWIADKYETLASDSIQFSAIEAFLSNSNYFSEQEANLKSLAEKLEANANTVSKLINSETGTNFNDYINQKRVELAKTRLMDADFKHLTVEAIGQTVGFKSKSAFYNAFKKHVGQSPLAFVKENIGQKQA